MDYEVTDVPPGRYAVIKRTVETPAQRAAVHLHVGPYEGLAQASQDFGNTLPAAGLTPSAEPREIYESPPDDPNPTTRIIWPLEA